jgi:4-hydroxythreonine-4-phosphate dehydrogenase
MTLAASASSAGRPDPALLILADDLTGAADCGVACVKRGLSAVVALAPEALPTDADVLAIDADTRALSAGAAARRSERLAVSLDDRKCIVFKKIDSTLRGHFGAELAATLSARREVFPDSVIVLAPAFPALGRTTIDGHHLLWGQPLEETELWRGEGRTGRAFLPRMVSDAGLRAEVLPLRRVREEGNEALAATMKSLAEKCEVIACDAETEADLAALAGASFRLGRGTIWAGSAGLVGHLADAAGLKSARGRNRLAGIAGAQVFVVGSRSDVSRRQAMALAALDEVEVIDVDPTASADELDSVNFRRRFSGAIETGKAVLVWQAREEPPLEAAKSRKCRDLAVQIAEQGSRIGALFATGGETARCLLDALDVRALRLVEEVEPGVALSVGIGGGELALITKAGAFGNDATMVACHAALSRAATHTRNVAVGHRRVGVSCFPS